MAAIVCRAPRWRMRGDVLEGGAGGGGGTGTRRGGGGPAGGGGGGGPPPRGGGRGAAPGGCDAEHGEGNCNAATHGTRRRSRGRRLGALHGRHERLLLPVPDRAAFACHVGAGRVALTPGGMSRGARSSEESPRAEE